jgi:hypothetical protein
MPIWGKPGMDARTYNRLDVNIVVVTDVIKQPNSVGPRCLNEPFATKPSRFETTYAGRGLIVIAGDSMGGLLPKTVLNRCWPIPVPKAVTMAIIKAVAALPTRLVLQPQPEI